MFKKLLLNPTKNGYVQLIRYGMVVAIAFPVDFGLLYIFTDKFHMYYVLSAVLSFTISMIVNFILSIFWVFKLRTKRALWKEAIVFAVIGFIGMGLTALIVWVATDFGGFHYMASKLIAVSVVFFWSFGARRYMFNVESWRFWKRKTISSTDL